MQIVSSAMSNPVFWEKNYFSAENFTQSAKHKRNILGSEYMPKGNYWNRSIFASFFIWGCPERKQFTPRMWLSDIENWKKPQSR